MINMTGLQKIVNENCTDHRLKWLCRKQNNFLKESVNTRKGEFSQKE